MQQSSRGEKEREARHYGRMRYAWTAAERLLVSSFFVLSSDFGHIGFFIPSQPSAQVTKIFKNIDHHS